MKNIDPTKRLNQSQFCELFKQLPLNEKEQRQVKDIYWQLYLVCVNNPDVTAEQAWLATKNVFICKEQQIKDRLDKMFIETNQNA